MNKLLNYGLSILVASGVISCRDVSKDYEIRGIYSGYKVASAYDGRGHHMCLEDTISNARIYSEQLYPYSGELKHLPVVIRYYAGGCSSQLEHYANIDSLKKIDAALKRHR